MPGLVVEVRSLAFGTTAAGWSPAAPARRRCTRSPRREGRRVLFEHRGAAGARDSVLKEHPTTCYTGFSYTLSLLTWVRDAQQAGCLQAEQRPARASVCRSVLID